MKLLLDTHVWIWFEAQPRRLTEHSLKLLSDPNNELWISVVSGWELLLLARKGRITVKVPAMEWIHRATREGRYRIADLNLEMVQAADQVQMDSRDPADHLLAGTSRHLGMPLLSADRQLQAGAGYDCLPA